VSTPRKRTARAKARAGAEAPAAVAPGSRARDLADAVARLLHAMRAEEVVRLDVSGVTDLADEFLIATVASTRQSAAIVEACEKERKARRLASIGVDAQPGSGWVVLDYGDLVVHLFLPEQRAYYGLEHLWADARRLE